VKSRRHGKFRSWLQRLAARRVLSECVKLDGVDNVAAVDWDAGGLRKRFRVSGWLLQMKPVPADRRPTWDTATAAAGAPMPPRSSSKHR